MDVPREPSPPELTRRACLAAALAATAAACDARLGSAARARVPVPPQATQEVLVVVFLRGALDGLSLCVPHADDDLYRARPRLAVPAPARSDGAVDLDGFFGLAPAARALEAPFRCGQLAVVHAAGLPHASRSHFDAMRALEAGRTEARPASRAGWIARLLDATKGADPKVARAIAIGKFLPQSLAGASDALAVEDPAAFRALRAEVLDSGALHALHAGRSPHTDAGGRRAIAALDALSRTRVEPREPGTGSPYPASELGRRLALASAWIRARTGVDVITIDSPGWDLHARMGPLDGALAVRMDDLARALAAFARDLGRDLGSTTLVVLSEFGRRVAENASLGTDHGRGSCLLVLGGRVAGGRVHGRWPGLSPRDLDRGDLAITTDVRDVLSEIAVRRLRLPGPAGLFPGHEPAARGSSILL